MTTKESIQQLLIEYNGTLTQKIASQHGLSASKMQYYVHTGLLFKEARGFYTGIGAVPDYTFLLSNKFESGVFSHGSAIYLHGLSDYAPEPFYEMTFFKGYHNENLDNHHIMSHTISNKDLFNSDIETIKSMHGNPIRVYSIERVLIDSIKSPDNYLAEVRSEAFKRYFKQFKNKRLSKMLEIAQKLNVEEQVKLYVESFL
ncbi:type IV toxin-antitoxin system AbiEi family antitoxin domain-containing protein [Dellaglioa algida]|uniref:type IV toxin-antitoxin system AbiEi family antitoxin domain-containing protein n=1 Tax=Dellaglioa algida TaxID=105612 RepID=UPI0024C4BC04|nr:hypothetical protein [Dellaglioa algida]MDK1727319.1 hypothetical protein [Dellaglioa algida]